jgi:predicted nucleotidyltransferase
MGPPSVVDRLRTALSAESGIACAWLFGSRARGEARADSDVDVAVLLDRDPAPTLSGSGVRLAGELERVVGATVDLIVLNRAPVDLVHRVLRDGILLLDRDPAARVRFEVASRNAWFDLKPILDRYRGAARGVRG